MVEVKSTVMVQLPPAAIEPPVNAMLVPPSTLVSAPPQVVDAPCGVAFVI